MLCARMKKCGPRDQEGATGAAWTSARAQSANSPATSLLGACRKQPKICKSLRYIYFFRQASRFAAANAIFSLTAGRFSDTQRDQGGAHVRHGEISPRRDPAAEGLVQHRGRLAASARAGAAPGDLAAGRTAGFGAAVSDGADRPGGFGRADDR